MFKLYTELLMLLIVMGKSELSRMSPFQMVISFMIAELAAMPPSSWAEKGLKEAKALGITDGNSPRDLASREQVALMIRAAVYAD